MVQRSDDERDKRSPGKSSEAEASRDAESTAANALRERIRQAGAAATARASDHAPPANGLLVPSSSAPPSAEHSGVRTRPPEPRATSTTPPVFGPPTLSPGAMSVPWPSRAPAAPRPRELQQTRDGLGMTPGERRDPAGAVQQDQRQAPDPRRGAAQSLPFMATTPAHGPPTGLGWSGSVDSKDPASAPPGTLESGPAPRGSSATPRGIAPPTLPTLPTLDTWSLSTARTQPMPRVRAEAEQGPRADDLGTLSKAEAEERRRAELATTKKTQGLLRAPDAASSNLGRYSVHDVSTEYVDTGAPEGDPFELRDDERSFIPEEPITEEVPAIDASAIDAAHAQAGEPEAADTRPRRSTPKQRVGHRRSTRPEMGHARERGTKRTDPGIRARTLRGGVSAKTAPQLPSVKTAPLSAPTLPAGVQPPSAAPLATTGNAITHRTSPLAAARPVSARPPPLPSYGSSSIVVDPSLSQPTLPAPSNPSTRTTARSAGGGYVPLPRDREAYEAFLRSAAGEHGGPPRSRPSWAQQETALIPREALEAPSYDDSSDDHSIWPSARTRALLGVVLIALSAAVGWWILEGQTAPLKPATSMPSMPSAQRDPSAAPKAVTLIATEPTGAELLQNGAVIGNTPFEVPRPSQGESRYQIRLRGFEQQIVLITNVTHDAINITLQPEAPPQAAPGRAR
jgi:hypothetical protein